MWISTVHFVLVRLDLYRSVWTTVMIIMANSPPRWPECQSCRGKFCRKGQIKSGKPTKPPSNRRSHVPHLNYC